jgi:hypothetical protein
MKRKLLPSTSPLPNFRSDQAAAEYFETHSVAEVWNGLREGKPGKPSKALAKAIGGRAEARRRLKRNLQNSKKPLACARGSEKPR